MRQRYPAQSVIEVLLLEQRLIEPRTVWACVRGRSPLGAEAVRFFDAARAEIAVGRALEQLPREWVVFHSLPVGERGSDVDHLVIGPGGIFSLHSDFQFRKAVEVSGRSVRVGTQRIPYIREAEYEAGSLTTLLAERMPEAASVQGVVVLVETKRMTVLAPPSRVKVIKVSELCEWLEGLAPVLTPLDRLEIAGFIDNPVLWQALGGWAPAETVERFYALEQAVARAQRVRLLWWPLALTVGALGAIGLASMLWRALAGG